MTKKKVETEKRVVEVQLDGNTKVLPKDRVVLLTLNFSKLGIWRATDSESMMVDADKEVVGLMKQIIDSDEYSAICSLDREINTKVWELALPAPLFKRGAFAIPVPNVNRVDEMLREFRSRRTDLVVEFVSKYPEKKLDAKARLRSLFREDDYPSEESVGKSFRMDWSWLAIDVPQVMEELNSGIFKEEREKAARRWDEAVEEWKDVMRQDMRWVCSKMSSALVKGTRFKSSTVESVTKWLNEFDALNVADDADLKEAVEIARGLMDGKTADDLRDDEKTREMVRKGFETLEKAVQIEPKPRLITFNKED